MATSGSTTHKDTSRIPVAYLIIGYEKNRDTIINVIRNAKTTVSSVFDSLQPAVNTKTSWIPREILNARQRGVKFRTIVDITKDNLQPCKEIMVRIDELRHVGGMGVNFVVTDTESIVMAPSLAPREEVTIQVIHSDSESVVEYKRLCFDSLWEKAVPAKSRIEELEKEGNVAERETKNMIDRIYACMKCKQTFLSLVEVDEHRRIAGHEGFSEYPLG